MCIQIIVFMDCNGILLSLFELNRHHVGLYLCNLGCQHLMFVYMFQLWENTYWSLSYSAFSLNHLLECFHSVCSHTLKSSCSIIVTFLYVSPYSFRKYPISCIITQAVLILRGWKQINEKWNNKAPLNFLPGLQAKQLFLAELLAPDRIWKTYIPARGCARRCCSLPQPSRECTPVLCLPMGAPPESVSHETLPSATRRTRNT